MVFMVTSYILGNPTVKHADGNAYALISQNNEAIQDSAQEAIISRIYYQNDEYILT